MLHVHNHEQGASMLQEQPRHQRQLRQLQVWLQQQLGLQL
jgi:hypothetical protein